MGIYSKLSSIHEHNVVVGDEAQHLAGVLNWRADRASRWRDDRQEWRLSDEAFGAVQQHFGPHTVDLFASRRNTLLPRYFSRWLDPQSAATDAFSRPWKLEGNPYAHPPIALISKVIKKVREEQCELTLVAPVWATQTWMTDLLEMSVAPPAILLAENLFEPVLPSRFVCQQPGWTTAVWRICGDASRPKALRSELRDALWPSTRATPT